MFYWILMWKEMIYCRNSNPFHSTISHNGDLPYKILTRGNDMNKSLYKVFSAVTIFALVLMALPVQSALAAGTISLTTIGNAYTENFDTLSNVAGSLTNTIAINGWELTETGGGTRDNEQYAVDTGGSGTGDTYSYGAAAATDRALGGLQCGTLIPVMGAAFVNNTGATITALDVAYTGEQWRIGNTIAARDDRLDL